jgi:hypothetical protein
MSTASPTDPLSAYDPQPAPTKRPDVSPTLEAYYAGSAGDVQKINELIVWLYEKLKPTLNYKVGKRSAPNGDELDDILQDLLLKLGKSVKGGAHPKAPRNRFELLVLAKWFIPFVVANAYRPLKKNEFFAKKLGDHPIEPALDGKKPRGPGPLTRLEIEEQWSFIVSATREAIGEEAALVIDLIYCEGLNPTEVEERSGLNRHQILRRKERAFKYLRGLLDDPNHVEQDSEAKSDNLLD